MNKNYMLIHISVTKLRGGRTDKIENKLDLYVTRYYKAC